MLKNISLVDRIEVPTQRSMTDAGQMIVPCAFARVGAQSYTAAQLNLQDADMGEVIAVLRDEADVFAEASMDSFRSAPVTIGHPVNDQGLPLSVTAENAADLQVGMLEGMPVRDEDLVTGTLVIARQEAIDLIDEGTVELSAGYTCDIEVVDNEDGTKSVYQRNIKANHIAIVPKGRAGSTCRIADEAEVVAEIKPEVEVAVVDDHPKPLREDFRDSDSFDRAMKIWEGNEAAEPEVVQQDVKAGAEESTPESGEGYSAKGKPTKEKQSTNDEAEVVVVDAAIVLADELKTALEFSITLSDERDALVLVVDSLRAELASSVEERVDVILIAKDLTDSEDFAGKTVVEIKAMVVADQLPSIDLTDKVDAYVEAMFDVAKLQANAETPMSKLLRDNAEPVKIAGKVDIVAEARANMIARQSK